VVLADDAVKAVKSPKVQGAAADAMEKTMTIGTRVKLHGGLNMSNWKGAPIAFDASYTGGTGLVSLPLAGGTYALADLGRRRARKRIRPKGRKRRGQRRPTLSTPWGPRTQVKGSKWTGFHLTDQLAPKALGKAAEAAIASAVKAFAQVD
jgi:hypothetical protein